MENLPVLYQGKEYLLIIQYASGFCEVIEKGDLSNKVELVHFTELRFNSEAVK
ncbi:hypothetical protein [Bacillus sp. FJAT-18017]|uniref:hypothetical protein n=1 Tax=Bacillus sp. FJAT-18017 TaxID=1705566 RepID=UPI000B14D84B|nr:hypothetical protein [Bacillus sp. FJAT-18017]